MVYSIHINTIDGKRCMVQMPARATLVDVMVHVEREWGIAVCLQEFVMDASKLPSYSWKRLTGRPLWAYVHEDLLATFDPQVRTPYSEDREYWTCLEQQIRAKRAVTFLLPWAEDLLMAPVLELRHEELHLTVVKREWKVGWALRELYSAQNNVANRRPRVYAIAADFPTSARACPEVAMAMLSYDSINFEPMLPDSVFDEVKVSIPDVALLLQRAFVHKCVCVLVGNASFSQVCLHALHLGHHHDRMYRRVARHLMTNREIALIVAVECAHHLQDIAPEFRQDPLFMRWVCLKAPGAVYYALGESKTSADVGLAALRSWLAKGNHKLAPNQIQVFEQVQWFGHDEVPLWDSSWQGISPGQAAFLLARALPKGFSFLPLHFKEKSTIALVAVHCWPGNMSLLPSSVSAIPWFWFRLYHGGNVKQAHLPSEKRWDPDMWSDIIVHGCGEIGRAHV